MRSCAPCLRFVICREPALILVCTQGVRGSNPLVSTNPRSNSVRCVCRRATSVGTPAIVMDACTGPDLALTICGLAPASPDPDRDGVRQDRKRPPSTATRGIQYRGNLRTLCNRYVTCRASERKSLPPGENTREPHSFYTIHIAFGPWHCAGGTRWRPWWSSTRNSPAPCLPGRPLHVPRTALNLFRAQQAHFAFENSLPVLKTYLVRSGLFDIRHVPALAGAFSGLLRKRPAKN